MFFQANKSKNYIRRQKKIRKILGIQPRYARRPRYEPGIPLTSDIRGRNISSLTVEPNVTTCSLSNGSFLKLYLGEILKIAKNVKNYLKISFAMLFMNYPIRNRHSERIRFLHTMLMLMSMKPEIPRMPEKICQESQCHQGWCHREHKELEQKEGSQLRNRLKIMMQSGLVL